MARIAGGEINSEVCRGTWNIVCSATLTANLYFLARRVPFPETPKEAKPLPKQPSQITSSDR